MLHAGVARSLDCDLLAGGIETVELSKFLSKASAACPQPKPTASLPPLATVPFAVLRALGAFRAIGPHLRCSSRWGALQRLVDAELAADDARVCRTTATVEGTLQRS